MGNNFGKFEEFKDIVERRVSETIEATKRHVIDYFKTSKYYNAEIPRVKENCVKEQCNPICSHGLCTGNPSIEGLIAHFKIGRFIYIYMKKEANLRYKVDTNKSVAKLQIKLLIKLH